MRNIDLNKIAVFVRVVDAGTFTGAAKSLGVPKSSVSRSVSQLEASLGVRLLQRTTRKLKLTEAGVAYHASASRALAGLDEARATVGDLHGTTAGTIRLTAPVDVGLLLARPLAKFTALHPGTKVELALTARLVDLVEEGFDLAIRAGHLGESSLIARKVGTSDLALFASALYLERRGSPKTPGELERHDCVTFRPTGGRATWLLSCRTDTQRVVVSGPLAADDFVFVKRAVLAGAGIGLLPEFTCSREEKLGKLVRVLPDFVVAGAPINLVYPSSRYLTRRVALLRDFLHAELTARYFGKR